MDKIIFIFFGPIIKSMLCWAKIVGKEKEADDFLYYRVIWVHSFILLVFSMGGILFVLTNMGIHYDRLLTCTYTLGIMFAMSLKLSFRAKKLNIVDNKKKEIEAYSIAELKRYRNRIMLTMSLPVCLYPLFVVFICYLLQTYVFHR